MTVTADLESLWFDYHDRILGFIGHKIRDPETTQDLRSIVYQRALVAMHNGNGYKTNPEAWLFRIARSVLLDYWRQQKRAGWCVELDEMPWDGSYDGDQDLGQCADNLRSPLPEPHEATVQTLQHEMLCRAIDRLTDEQAHVLSMRLDGYSMDEIATATGKEYFAVKAMEYRARQSIAPHVRKMWDAA